MTIENTQGWAEVERKAREFEVKTKSVDWSYPTSTNACQFGHARSGCWTVSVKAKPTSTPKALAGFKLRADAMEYANRIKCNWSASFLQFNEVHP